MDITGFVDGLRRDLEQAALAAGPEGAEVAERMLLALEPAFRLTAMELLAQAAAEITADLAAGTVEVRLRGRDPELVVDVPAVPPVEPAEPVALPAEPDEEEDGAIARVTLRIPEAVKARAEEHAARLGVSLNSWVVNVLRRATSEQAVRVDVDLSSLPLGIDRDLPRPGLGRRMTGWV